VGLSGAYLDATEGAAVNERFDSRMNQSDTTMWRIEADPSLRTTIVGITILDRAPKWERLRARIDDVSWEIPRLRQRVVEPAFGMGVPRWVQDPRFDLDYHLRRVVAPAPGDLQTLLDIAGPIDMAAFDRERPLWEFTLVEGLADGRAALIQKIHHCLTDGVGAIRMARIAFDEHEDDHAKRPDRRLHGTEQRPSGLMLAVDSMTEQAVHTAQLMGRTATKVPGAMEKVMLHPMRVVNTVTGTAKSIVKLVRPAREPLSPVMRERGMSRRLVAIDLSLTELKASGHAVGGTTNDAFLAAVTGGMRRYHVAHGKKVHELRVTMPINLRTGDESIGNNRFTPARFAVPIDVVDPEQRMRRLGEMARSWRKEPGLKFTDVVAGALNAVPPAMTTALMGSMLKAIDFVATNVPGLDRPVHLAGATVEQQFAFAPPSGAAFSAALLSYLDRCTLGMVIDTAAVKDPEVLARCMAEGFEEVLAVGRAKPAKRATKKAARTPARAPARSSGRPPRQRASA
jgi:WS/DGAT/MGAT family acyltransferase